MIFSLEYVLTYVVDSYGDPQEGGLGVDVTVEGDPVRPALHVEGRDGGMMGYLNKLNTSENTSGKSTLQRISNSVFENISWIKPFCTSNLGPSGLRTHY